MLPRPVLADSLRCISSCLAFLLRSSVASNSLFCMGLVRMLVLCTAPRQPCLPEQ